MRFTSVGSYFTTGSIRWPYLLRGTKGSTVLVAGVGVVGGDATAGALAVAAQDAAAGLSPIFVADGGRGARGPDGSGDMVGWYGD